MEIDLILSMVAVALVVGFIGGMFAIYTGSRQIAAPTLSQEERCVEEVALCQFANVTLVNERVMAVWFMGDKCSLLTNDGGEEFAGKKIERPS